MTVLQITPGLPPTYGPYKVVPSGARYFMAGQVAASLAPYPDRLGIVLHLVNYQNVGGTAEAFFRNHFVPPGDKTSSSGSKYGTCYHVIVAGDGSVVVALDERAAPNSAGTVSNQRFIHIVMLMGDWSKPDARHERTLEAVAQVCAKLCVGFGIPARWHHVYEEPNAQKRLAAALHLTNPDRAKVGIFAHRDITAAYTTLMRAGMTTRAAPFKNNHGDTGNYFPAERLIARVRQIIEGDNDMATLVKVDDPADLALFEASGSTWRWIPDWAMLGKLQGDGLVGTELRRVPRANLALYRLVGADPASVFPQYSTTTGAQFASHDPAA